MIFQDLHDLVSQALPQCNNSEVSLFQRPVIVARHM